jgi:hypothetical protein
LLLRLERHGILAPTVLAKGQFLRPSGWADSFLLTEPAGDALRLDLWLQRQARWERQRPEWTPPSHGGGSPLPERREVLQGSGALLARLHQACCYLAPSADIGLLAVQLSARSHRVLLQDIDGVRPARAPSLLQTRRDHERLRRWLVAAGCGPEELRHMDHGYRRQLLGRDEQPVKEASACRA